LVDANELYSIDIRDNGWGGPNSEDLAVTRDEKVFIGYFDADKITPRTKYTIKRIK